MTAYDSRRTGYRHDNVYQDSERVRDRYGFAMNRASGPTDQSGRPVMVTAVVVAILVVLAILAFIAYSR